jgi:hypothetical protein
MDDFLATDVDHELMLDGNAAAGLLHEIFGAEMTASATECAHCGHEGQVGTLLAFTQGPGLVLRCPGCEGIMLRIVETPNAFLVDARGAAYLRIARFSAARTA